jgi:hypothetical protein
MMIHESFCNFLLKAPAWKMFFMICIDRTNKSFITGDIRSSAAWMLL